jgi:hypothetical protein
MGEMARLFAAAVVGTMVSVATAAAARRVHLCIPQG